jgi:hypothetical protein
VIEDPYESFQKGFEERRIARPAQAALIFALFTRTFSFFDRWQHATIVNNKDFESDLLIFRAQLGALAEWLAEPGVLKSPTSMHDEIEQSVRFSLEWGQTVAMAMELREMIEYVWSQTRKGRPAEKKTLAVLAYDKKLTNPDLTWDAVTEQVCPCTKGYHDDTCREAIRQEVNQLKKFLKTYNIEITVRQR